MSKSAVTVSTSWVKVADGACVITVKSKGTGVLYVDEAETDTDVTPNTAYEYEAGSVEKGSQFEQTQTVDTWVKASGTGWVILVDGATV